MLRLIQEAVRSGARLPPACSEAEIDLRTYRRWQKSECDLRPVAKRPEPKNKLTAEEKQAILAVCNQEDYASMPPTQIVPTLLDKGEYIASESSFYRVLRVNGQSKRRRTMLKGHSKPAPCVANQANDVWSWDITYLSSRVKGQYFYLYAIEDIFSRKVVGHEVHTKECGELASQLLTRTMMKEQCFNSGLTLHSDNGAAMKSFTFKAKMEELGVKSSYSRPSVSDDNPYIESLFSTLKSAPSMPMNGFENVEEARAWTDKFFTWYNTVHKHSKLKYITPDERHRNLDEVILQKRLAVLEAARMRNPRRWSGKIRNCEPIGVVHLNPYKKPENKTA